MPTDRIVDWLDSLRPRVSSRFAVAFRQLGIAHEDELQTMPAKKLENLFYRLEMLVIKGKRTVGTEVTRGKLHVLISAITDHRAVPSQGTSVNASGRPVSASPTTTTRAKLKPSSLALPGRPASAPENRATFGMVDGKWVVDTALPAPKPPFMGGLVTPKMKLKLENDGTWSPTGDEARLSSFARLSGRMKPIKRTVEKTPEEMATVLRNSRAPPLRVLRSSDGKWQMSRPRIEQMAEVKPREQSAKPAPFSDARQARQLRVWRDDELRWEISYDTDEQRETWDRVVKPIRTEGGVHVASVERAKQLKEAEAQATKRFFNPSGPKGKAWLAEFSKPACPRLTRS